jgi:hypothetical protein
MVINGATVSVLRVGGAVSSDGTASLAQVQFTARRPGTMLFTPVSYALSTSAFCRMTEQGADVLGAPGVPGDGVRNASVVVAEPEPIALLFEPQATLFAGIPTPVALRADNTHGTFWDALSARLLIDGESAIVPAGTWDTRGQTIRPLSFSSSIHTESNSNTAFYDAQLALRLAATTGSATIASLPLIPTAEDVLWIYDTSTNAAGQSPTDVSFEDVSVLNRELINTIDEGKWRIFPHGACVWISDSAQPPVLGSNYVLTVRVENPHGLAVQRVTFAYAFDATLMEVSQPVPAAGMSTNRGGVWISNRLDDGYICGDVWCDTVTTARNVAVLHITIRPKLNRTLELLPELISVNEETDIGMGLWTPQGFNALELLDEYPEDLCPAWHRGVVWLDVPLLSLGDQDLSPFESLVFDFAEILVNGSSNKTYKWWIEGAQNHVSAILSAPQQTLTLTSLDTWRGSERLRLCCQEIGSPYVGDTFFTVFLEGDYNNPLLDVQLPRDEFLAATGSLFDQCAFTVMNATGAVIVSADITGPDNVRRTASVRNDATGVVGPALDIRGAGTVLWNMTGVTPGFYRGRITARYSAAAPAVTADFAVDVFQPGQDDDGDTYYLLYRGPAGRRVFTGRSVEIQNGTERDSLTMVVNRSPDGDGLVTMDAIVSDSGMQRMRLKGGVNTITLNGSLGALMMEGGSLGQLTVTRGDIGSVLIRTRWLKNDLLFVENVGIAHGVTAAGSINTIMVLGGMIGDPDAPALIRAAHGSIGTVATALKVRAYVDTGDRYFELSSADGANINAGIEAPYGAIGKITATGGSIGAPDDYPLCTVRAGGAIRVLRAVADVVDGTPLGGSLYAAVHAGGAVGRLDAIGGDITRSEIMDPEDIAEPDHFPVRIIAASINSLKALARVCAYDGSKFAFGGTAHAVLDVQYGINTISALGGDACLLASTAHAPSRIKALVVRRIVFKEYRDDTEPVVRGGNLTASAVSTAACQVFKSTSPADYHGPLMRLAVDGAIRNSWIGFAAKPTARALITPSFRFGSLDNSEIWEAARGRIYVNGR